MRASTLAFSLSSSLTVLVAGAVDAAVSSSSSSTSTSTPHGSVDSTHGATPIRATSPPSRLRGAAMAAVKTEAAKAPGAVVPPPSPPQCLDAHGAPLTTHFREGHLYAHVTTMPFESWHEADQAAGDLTCCQVNGRLLVVNDAPEREFIKAVVVGTAAGSASAGGAWMAIVDDANDGVWASAERPTHEAGDTDSSPVMGEDMDGCGEDANYYDDKDYRYGVRCRPTISLPILVEFECPRGP